MMLVCISGIAERVRNVLKTMPGADRPNEMATRLGLATEPFATLLSTWPQELLDAGFLIDAIVALVRYEGINSEWLLTGVYSASQHRSVDEPLRLRPELREYVRGRLDTVGGATDRPLSNNGKPRAKG